MPTPIDLYEEICALSQRMVNAARANDWNSLVELEHRVAVLRDELMANDENLSLSMSELLHKHGLIQQILEDDAEIRRHTEPWMERVRQFLGAQNHHPQAHPAYAADSNTAETSQITANSA